MEWLFFTSGFLFLLNFSLLVTIFILLIILSAAFSYPESGFIVYFEVFVEICFGIDIALTFLSAYIDDE